MVFKVKKKTAKIFKKPTAHTAFLYLCAMAGLGSYPVTRFPLKINRYSSIKILNK